MEQDYAGRSGDIGGYQVEIDDESVRVLKAGVTVVRHRVAPHGGRSLADVVAGARQPRLRWGRLPEGDEVIIVFDATDGDDALSYAINISNPARSGWTYGHDLLAAVEASD